MRRIRIQFMHTGNPLVRLLTLGACSCSVSRCVPSKLTPVQDHVPRRAMGCQARDSFATLARSSHEAFAPGHAAMPTPPPGRSRPTGRCSPADLRTSPPAAIRGRMAWILIEQQGA